MGGSIAENLYQSCKIERAARKSGRIASEVKLVAVTKTVDIKKIPEAIKAGAIAFEKTMQEAQEKIENSIKSRFNGTFGGIFRKK